MANLFAHVAGSFTAPAFEQQYGKDGTLELEVESCQLEEIGGSNKEIKPVMRFVGDPRKLVINKENYEILSEQTGSMDVNDWVGQKVLMYWNGDVNYNGRRGGLRFKRGYGKKSKK